MMHMIEFAGSGRNLCTLEMRINAGWVTAHGEMAGVARKSAAASGTSAAVGRFVFAVLALVAVAEALVCSVVKAQLAHALQSRVVGGLHR